MTQILLCLAVSDGAEVGWSQTKFFCRLSKVARVPVAGDYIVYADGEDAVEIDRVELLADSRFSFFYETVPPLRARLGVPRKHRRRKISIECWLTDRSAQYYTGNERPESKEEAAEELKRVAAKFQLEGWTERK